MKTVNDFLKRFLEVNGWFGIVAFALGLFIVLHFAVSILLGINGA